MAREIRLLRALADEGYQYTLNDGVPPIPRDRMVTFTSLPEAHRAAVHGRDRGGRRAGRHAPRRRPDQPGRVRDYDLLVPASTEALVRERHTAARDAYERDADRWREEFIAEHGVIPPPGPP